MFRLTFYYTPSELWFSVLFRTTLVLKFGSLKSIKSQKSLNHSKHFVYFSDHRVRPILSQSSQATDKTNTSNTSKMERMLFENYAYDGQFKDHAGNNVIVVRDTRVEDEDMFKINGMDVFLDRNIVSEVLKEEGKSDLREYNRPEIISAMWFQATKEIFDGLSSDAKKELRLVKKKGAYRRSDSNIIRGWSTSIGDAIFMYPSIYE